MGLRWGETEAPDPAAAHTRVRGCGAVCRALQESSALLPVHHHHHHSLIVRNHAGPLLLAPVSLRIPIRKRGTPMYRFTLIPFSHALRSSSLASAVRVLLRALRCKVNRASPIESTFTSPSVSSCQHPPSRRQSAACAVEGASNSPETALVRPEVVASK